jgi:hypothetical protein
LARLKIRWCESTVSVRARPLVPREIPAKRHKVLANKVKPPARSPEEDAYRLEGES